MSENSPEVDAVIAEAKTDFDLTARLQGRKLRKGSITLITDEETGDLLGEAIDEPIKNGFGLVVDRRIVRTGVLGDIAALIADDSEENADEIAALEIERDELIATLKATALTVNLRGVPKIIIKGVRREARAALGITEKGVPEDRAEEFNDEHAKRLLAAATASIFDHESGATKTKVTVEDAGNMIDLLPISEDTRLQGAVADIMFKDAVSEAVTGTADFSLRT